MTNVLFYDAYARDEFFGGSCIGLKRLLKCKKNPELQYHFLVNQLNKKYFDNNIKSLGVKSLVIKFPKQLFEYDQIYVNGVFKQLFLFLFIVLPLNIRLAYILKKNKIDRVICNEVRAALTVGTAAKFAGVPLITYIRGDALINHYLTKTALKISNGIICISEGIYELVNNKYKKKALVINDGIEYCDGKISSSSGTVNIFNAAYITAIKGQIVLLKAVNELKEKYKNLKCYFIGAVSDEKYYRELIEYIKLNMLDDYVVFTGFVNNVYEYFSKGGIYVQPSFTEGLPLSILEAYMFKLPVISSDLPGIAPLLKKNHCGILFEKGDYKDLSQKISSLIEDKELAKYYGMNGGAMVNREYLIEATASKFEDYILK